jgi:hypothetical protein
MSASAGKTCLGRREQHMKAILIGTALALAFASYAGAEEMKQAKSPAPVVKAQNLSDAEMDKVTAGSNGADFGCCSSNPSGNYNYPYTYGASSSYRAGVDSNGSHGFKQ